MEEGSAPPTEKEWGLEMAGPRGLQMGRKMGLKLELLLASATVPGTDSAMDLELGFVLDSATVPGTGSAMGSKLGLLLDSS